MLNIYAAGGGYIQNHTKKLKNGGTLAHGYSSESTQQELSMNTNMTGIKWCSKTFEFSEL